MPSSRRSAKLRAMALSDDEQRILREIEQELQNDSKFADAVSSSGLYRHSVRQIRWAIVGLVLSVVVLAVSLQVHFVLAFAIFVVMLALIALIERNARAIGRAGLQDVAGAIRKARESASRRLQ